MTELQRDEQFETVFRRQLAGTIRYGALSRIAWYLRQLDRPVSIVETGCCRKLDNWEGDGQSTIVWDWAVLEFGGKAMSYDISSDAVRLAQGLAPEVEVVESDSVVALSGQADAESIDVLYLDSMDYDGEPSARHHLAELGAIWDRLRPGCLIAVDDNFSDKDGKGALIWRRLAKVGIEPTYQSHIVIWQKPEGALSWAEMEAA
jgi:hypothetical protein